MKDKVEQVILQGDADSCTELVMCQTRKLKVASKTIALPEPTFGEISHLMSDKPLRFSQRRFLS